MLLVEILPVLVALEQIQAFQVQAQRMLVVVVALAPLVVHWVE
jgi:hypothetical protein